MKAIETALERRQTPLDIFVRNDDGGWAQDELDLLLGLCADRQCPIDVAVIPAALDQPTAKWLHHWRIAFPGLGLHQHGFSHSNHEQQGARKCEFGPSRPTKLQAQDIAQGKQQLEDLLGEIDPIFTPPWNRCVPGTLDVLCETGFALLSGDPATASIEPSQIAQLPITLDWERMRREGHLAESVSTQIVERDTIGLMLHHETMDSSARQELGAILDIIIASDKANFRSMRSWVGENL